MVSPFGRASPASSRLLTTGWQRSFHLRPNPRRACSAASRLARSADRQGATRVGTSTFLPVGYPCPTCPSCSVRPQQYSDPAVVNPQVTYTRLLDLLLRVFGQLEENVRIALDVVVEALTQHGAGAEGARPDLRRRVGLEGRVPEVCLEQPECLVHGAPHSGGCHRVLCVEARGGAGAHALARQRLRARRRCRWR